MDVKTKTPVDNSIYIVATTANSEYKAYCNEKGNYTFTIPDSLNGQLIWVRPVQDKKRVLQNKTSPPCATDCTLLPVYEFKPGKRIRINTDSSRLYRINFGGRVINNHLSFPQVYFKKNELEILPSDYYPSVDSAICNVKNILQCNKTWVIEIQGHCSPQEEDRERLSEKRAALLKEKLIRIGIHPNRMIIKGYADSIPAAMEFANDNGDPVQVNTGDEARQRVSFSVIRRNFAE